MHNIYPLLLLTVMISTQSNAQTLPSRMDFDTLLRGAKWSDEFYQSCEGHYDCVWTKIDTTFSVRGHESGYKNDSFMVSPQNSMLTNIYMAKSPPLIRFDSIAEYILPVTDKRYYFDLLSAYDGEKWSVIDRRYYKDDTNITISGVITDKTISYKENKDISFYSMNVFGTPVHNFLNGEPVMGGKVMISRPSIIRHENHEGVECVVLHTATDNSDDNLTVWLAPDMMFRPARIEYMFKDMKNVIINTFKKEAVSHVWIPVNCVKYFYVRDESLDYKLITSVTFTTHDDFAVGHTIDPQVFKIEFPENIIIADIR